MKSPASCDLLCGFGQPSNWSQRTVICVAVSELVVIDRIFVLFQSPDCNDRVQVQRLLLNCPDIGKFRELHIKPSLILLSQAN